MRRLSVILTLILSLAMGTLILGLLGLINGCAGLAPGADPLVVRVEQSEQAGRSTFTAVLQIDNANRPFFLTNAPAFHDFCEWLRGPVLIEQTNTLPRNLAMVLSLDDAKLAYQSGRADSNSLFTLQQSLDLVVSDATGWLQFARTNH